MIWLRGLGFTVDKVERRLPRGFVTVDFMGFADLLAVRPRDVGVLAIQATTNGHLQERVRKVQAEPRATLWVECGNRVWVVGWAWQGPRDTRKRWAPKVLALDTAGGVFLIEYPA